MALPAAVVALRAARWRRGLLLQVCRGMLVYDPFVGTGSILVAAAHHGAATFGADIDPRVICLGKVRDAFRSLWSATELHEQVCTTAAEMLTQVVQRVCSLAGSCFRSSLCLRVQPLSLFFRSKLVV